METEVNAELINASGADGERSQSYEIERATGIQEGGDERDSK